MIHRIPNSVVLLCLIGIGCSSQRYYLDEVPTAEIALMFRPTQPLPGDDQIFTADDYKVLTIVIDSLLPSKYSPIILGDSTIPYPFLWFPIPGIDSVVSRQLTSDLRLVSQHRTTFSPDSIGDTRPKILLSQSQFTKPFPHYNYGAIWDAYYRRFPKALGIIRFSRVAYDSSGTLALLYTDHMYHSLRGQERLFLLFERGSRWFIQQSYLLREVRGLEF